MRLSKKKSAKKKKNVVKITVIDEEAAVKQLNDEPLKSTSGSADLKPSQQADQGLNGIKTKKSTKKSILKRLIEKEIKKDEAEPMEPATNLKSAKHEELVQAAQELEQEEGKQTSKKSAKAKRKTKPKKKSKRTLGEEKLAASIVNLTDKLAKLEQPETGANYEVPKPKIRFYRKVASFFVLVVFLLLGVVAYYSLVKVDIIIVPAQEQVSNNLIVDVYDQEKADNSFSDAAIAGAVATIPITETKAYEASGEKMLSEEVVGKVTIINNYIKNQPLVATTRLLTPDEKLFRIKRTVNVPAGGSVEVEVYADKPGPDMVIGPTRFTIPGLWVGLQDKIYAVSKEKMHYDRKVKKYITQVDIDDAVADLKKSLQTKLAQTAKEKYSNYDVVLFAIDDNSIAQEVYGKVDEEKDEFSMSMSAKAVVVAFNKKDALALVKKKFTSKIGGSHKQVDFNEQSLSYSLDDYAVDRDTASVNITFDAHLALKDKSQIIDPNMLVGLSQRQLEEFLKAQENIAGFEIHFHPSFIKRVPNLVDRINIIIKSK